MVEDDRDIDIETDGDGDDEVNGRVRRNRVRNNHYIPQRLMDLITQPAYFLFSL